MRIIRVAIFVPTPSVFIFFFMFLRIIRVSYRPTDRPVLKVWCFPCLPPLPVAVLRACRSVFEAMLRAEVLSGSARAIADEL